MMKKDVNKMRQKKQRAKIEMNYRDWYMMTWAWNYSGLLALAILIPFILQGFWSGTFNGVEASPGVQLILFFATWFWLFVLTMIIIFIDDHRLFPIRLNLCFGQRLNWTTMAIWVGFIVLPVSGSLLLPGRQMFSLTVLYLVMGLANFLFKLNRTKALRRWLESSSISQDEVQHIYEITEVKDIGLYVLAGWPWWIIRIETQPKSRFVVNVYEPEERQLVNVMQGSKGRKWRKRYSTIDKAVRRMGIQLRQLEETAWYT
ncbi:MAG: hypothetical protein CL608_26255 [Anaerolineaceae bacterium]|nr:hypothetical protein [Anaerolineaceae bacterium]